MRYYVLNDDSTGEPWLLVRRFSDGRDPESFRPGEGWVASRDLERRFWKGELDETDVISEADAAKVAERLTAARFGSR